MEFLDKLDKAVQINNSLLCVGLDPDLRLMPEHLHDVDDAYYRFCKIIIDVTADSACAFKPNTAFFEARGAKGIQELKQTCDYINEKYPTIPIILDFKRGDIGSTNDQYAQFAFDYLGVDAITIQPYMGHEAVQPFLDRKEKGIIVLGRTSNSGSDEFQDIESGGDKLYMKVAKNVATEWNANGNCLLVVGATYPDELALIRKALGDEMVFLVPGVGAQGGDIGATVKAGLNSKGKGIIVNSTRAIIYASSNENFAEAARASALETRDEINKYRGA